VLTLWQSQKRALEDSLNRVAQVRKEKAELYGQISLKIKEIREAQGTGWISQQDAEKRNMRLEQSKSDLTTLEAALYDKYPLEYRVFTRGLEGRLSIACKDLELERRTSNHLKAENQAKRNSIEKQDKLLQQMESELDVVDQELRGVRARKKMLEGKLRKVQQDLAQTLRMASNLASRLTDTGVQ
jgi:hypothetical protein